MDNDHKAFLVTAAEREAEQIRVFEFDDPAIAIDYTVWTPDGEWILFDRRLARSGDIWTVELPESTAPR